MIIAVTGGTGFVGAGVVRAHLARGDEVRVLTRRQAIPWPDVRLVRGSLTDERIPEAFFSRADVLYHCAGEIGDASVMQAVHVDGTERLVTQVRGSIGRWVQLSSVGVYGRQRDGVVTEETVGDPIGPYECTKAASDRLIGEAQARGDLETVIVRPSTIFGPDMPNQSVFALINAVERGLFVFVGPKGASANYIPVENVVDALVACATSPAAAGDVFNLSAFTAMEEFIGMIAAALGRQTPALRMPRTPLRMAAAVLGAIPGWPLSVSRIDALSGRAVYSTDRIESRVGYRPRVSVRDGIERTVAAWSARTGR